MPLRYSPYLSIGAACAAEIAFPLSSGITPVFLLWTDGLAMLIVVFGVGGGRLPAKHGACQHSGFLSFGDTNSSICDVGNFSIGFSIDFHFRKQISFFSPCNNNQLSAGRKNTKTVGWQRRTQRNDTSVGFLQTFRKLTDMIEGAGIVAAGFKVGFVDKPAGSVTGSSAARENADVIAVRDAEDLLVAGSDKTDTLLSLFHVVFQEPANIGIKIKIIVPIIGIAPEHIGVMVGFQLEAVLGTVVAHHLGFWTLLTIAGHAVTAEKQSVFLPQAVDHFIKLRFELVGLILPTMIKP